jgi:regulator of sirC expression with transglutaminase-like and TPR domain
MNVSVDERQLRAAIMLLAGPDERTVDLVRRQLVRIGQPVLTQLEKAAREADPWVRERLNDVVEEIQFASLTERLRAYSESAEDPDLEEGVFLLARYAYPDLDLDRYRMFLDRLAEEALRRLSGIRHPIQRVQKINDYLFREQGFHGNRTNYYDPDNSYINRVLDRRRGIPISLSVLYLLVSRRLGLPVVGVGLPGHFMTRYETEEAQLYIDVFNGGHLLTKQDCLRLLVQTGYEPKEAYFGTAAAREILIRILKNLVYVYSEAKEDRKARQLSAMIELLAPK